MKNVINWKIFLILLTLSLVSVICIFPYVLSVQGNILKTIGQPIELLFIAQFIQCFVLFSITIFFGLILTKKIGFRLPLLEALVGKKDFRNILKNIFVMSVLTGAAVAAVIYGLDALFTALGVGVTTHQSYAPIWQKLIAALYGGVTEELLLRLFLMALFIWLSMKLWRRNKPTRVGILVAIVLAAIIFGLGHLPITASLVKLNALIVTRAVVLNGIGGVVFGWLFWKKGLESAMIAHFSADVFLLTILPLLFK
jgi:membrane protease YdiL (CAAX protease family)